ncbi:MAG: hypothetical protein IJ571_03140 [Ruminococcus sp.]|nr:hypothetical protein [Ruminococcus sp.]
MKKFTALLVSVLMACTVCVGCGDSDSSSKSEKSNSSSAAAVKKSAAVFDVNSDTHLAQQYTDKIKEGNFSLAATSDYTGDEPMVLELCGDDLHVKMSFLGISMNVYVKDGTGYMIDEDSKEYATQDASDYTAEQVTSQSMGLDDSYTFVSSETADGFICETYEMSMVWETGSDVVVETEDDDSNKQTIKYYFDENTGMLKKIETVAFGYTSTSEIVSLDFDISEIKLPDDFDSYTEISADEFAEKMSAGLDTEGLGDTFGVETEDAE